jgi:xylan 1,4-beta-xylosidase
VWNEPNLHHFWTGTQEDYFNLYRYTVGALKDVDERLRVGGPATAKNQWIEGFVTFCEKNHLPADFVGTHHVRAKCDRQESSSLKTTHST